TSTHSNPSNVRTVIRRHSQRSSVTSSISANDPVSRRLNLGDKHSVMRQAFARVGSIRPFLMRHPFEKLPALIANSLGAELQKLRTAAARAPGFERCHRHACKAARGARVHSFFKPAR